ncbi:nucleolin [Aquila chrysaetos chrysaetos]|uniref:nucleolin n=1 Tax=Aquila chrysaetos chrysaetos TaxID=223781 RepID=UPI001176D51F|nr:nucleolin [Aquila chrysaetos chrysaetos]
MVKIAKTPKNQIKQKKMAPPPKKVEESEEEESSELEESSGEEMIPQKKQQKAAVTPAKKAATPAKKAAIPAKKAITPAKKTVATPAKKAVAPSPKKAAVLTKGAKNGKNAKKEESEEEDEDDEEDEEEEDEDEEEEEEEEDSDEEEEPAMPVKPAAKKPAAVPAKKPAVVPAKQESEEEEEEEEEEDDEEEDDESEDEAMDTTPVQVKKPTPAKAAPVKAKADSEDEEDEEDDEEEDDDEEEEDEEDAEEESEDEKPVKEAPGKRKKEMANKSAPEAKKKKTDGPTSAFSLFVGNLVPTKEYEELKTGIKEFFGKKNIEVLDVRIGASKRFGYVDFSSAEDLDKALQLNGKKLMGLEIKLEKAKSKETMKENKKERDARTLFVKNLPYRLTEDEMREVFENALEIRIVMNKEGNSKGMAYIEFKTEAEANKALEEKQGTEIDGRAMVIDFTGEKSHQEHQKGGGERESKTLIVNNLSYAASEETLQELFKKASSIKMPQTNQGRPKGYAFVEFPTTEDAKEALNSCNNTEIEGRAIRLEFSSPAWQKGNMNARGGFNQQSKTLFVRGLSEDTTEETLRESFEGSISARIVTDRDTGSSKGFGFVDFSSPEDAKAAKEAMEDGEIDGNKVILDFAKPKGEFQRGGGFGGRGGRGGGRGGRGGFGGRGGGRGFGGRGGGFRGGRGGGGDHKPQGKKIKFE